MGLRRWARFQLSKRRGKEAKAAAEVGREFLPRPAGAQKDNPAKSTDLDIRTTAGATGPLDLRVTNRRWISASDISRSTWRSGRSRSAFLKRWHWFPRMF